jgi:hypothetical protein
MQSQVENGTIAPSDHRTSSSVSGPGGPAYVTEVTMRGDAASYEVAWMQGLDVLSLTVKTAGDIPLSQASVLSTAHTIALGF